MKKIFVFILAIFLTGCTTVTPRPKNTIRTVLRITPRASATAADDFIKKMDHVTGSQGTSGNKVTLLTNGDEAFPAMLSAIDNAKERISFETYIIRLDILGTKFYKALVRAAKRGVKIRFLCDSVGSRTVNREHFKELLENKGEVRFFNPVKNWTVIRLNNRDHRKILVVDNKVAFMGGLNLAEEYDGNGSNGWRDTAVRIEGEAAIAAEHIFLSSWYQGGAGYLGKDLPLVGLTPIKRAIDEPFMIIFSKKDNFVSPLPSPPDKAGENGFVRAVSSAPDRMASNILDMYLLAINSSQKRVWITSGYFIPPWTLSRAMTEAVQRGVDVRLITQGQTDEPTVRKISVGFYGKLLEKGIKIYEWKNTVLHSKTMLVDDNWGTIGSANLDGRALYLNYEANFAFIDKDCVNDMAKQFEEDLKNCREITFEEWKKRDFKQKAGEVIMTPIENQF
ncbi:MAG: phospholipase D-like domain-containing protein [Planctomycetota bacterium]|jgi:cardiolipin synthase